MLILAEKIIDDFGKIFNGLPSEQRILITAKENVTEKQVKELKKIFSKVFPIADYYSSANLELKVLDIYKKYKFSRIITSASAECDLLRASQLREYLGLDGQSYQSALAFKDKIAMKNIVFQAGFNTPFYKEIYSGIDLIRFVDEQGYPVIVKPRREGSSVGTELLKNKKDLSSFLKRYFNSSQHSNLMAESFVNGKLFHVDGFKIKDKVFSWPSIYKSTALDMMEGRFFANHLLELANPLTSSLNEYTKKVLSCFPTPENMTFHFELFQKPDGEFVFCEIASRVGGGYIERMWAEAFEVSLREMSYNFQRGVLPTNLDKILSPKSIPASVVFPRRKGILRRIDHVCPLEYISRYVTFCKKGDRLEKSPHTSSALLSGFIVGNSEEDSWRKIEGFVKWARKTIEYK